MSAPEDGSTPFHAMCLLTGATATIVQQRGITGVVRVSIGIYEFTLDQALDSTECLVLLGQQTGPNNETWVLTHISDTVKRITMAGTETIAAADAVDLATAITLVNEIKDFVNAAPTNTASTADSDIMVVFLRVSVNPG